MRRTQTRRHHRLAANELDQPLVVMLPPGCLVAAGGQDRGEPRAVQWDVAALAVCVGALAGLSLGVWLARRAAWFDPIAAPRHDRR
jgi:hypothetical protein